MQKLIAVFLMLGGLAVAQHQVTMKWTASTTRGVRYRVYRGKTSGGPYDLLKGSVNTLQYQDKTVKPGTYYYVIRAFYYPSCVNKFGPQCESLNSNQITAVVPK